MKLRQAVNSVSALNKLLQTSLPVKIAYKIGKLVVKLEPEVKIFNDAKNNLVKELGEEEAGNWTLKPASSNWPKYVEEITKLEEIDIDLGFGIGKEIEKIKIDDLGDIKAEPNDLIVLDWLIE